MPPKAEVFVAEDDIDWQRRIRDLLNDAGHRVAATATTRKQAFEVVGKLKELGIMVATVDGNLNQYDSNGADGAAVIATIRQHAPEVKIVGLSGSFEGVRGADVQVWKGQAAERLADEVTGL